MDYNTGDMCDKYPGPLFRVRGKEVFWDSLYIKNSVIVRPCLLKYAHLSKKEKDAAKLLGLNRAEWDGQKPFTSSVYNDKHSSEYCLPNLEHYHLAFNILAFDHQEHTINSVFRAKMIDVFEDKKKKFGSGYIEYETLKAFELDLANTKVLTVQELMPSFNFVEEELKHATNETKSRSLGGSSCLLEAFCFGTGHHLKELGIKATQCFPNHGADTSRMCETLLNSACRNSEGIARAFVLRFMSPSPTLSFEGLLGLKHGIYFANVTVNTLHGYRVHYIVWDAWRSLLFLGGGNQFNKNGEQFLAGILRLDPEDLADLTNVILSLKSKNIKDVLSIRWLACRKGLMHQTSHVLAKYVPVKKRKR